MKMYYCLLGFRTILGIQLFGRLLMNETIREELHFITSRLRLLLQSANQNIQSKNILQ